MSVQPAVGDFSGWIEVFTDGPQGGQFLDVLEVGSALIVPAISILELHPMKRLTACNRLNRCDQAL